MNSSSADRARRRRARIKFAANRYRDAIGVCLIGASNILPYRLFRSVRAAALKAAGVGFAGRRFILGPIFVSYPSRLSFGDDVFVNVNTLFENAANISIGNRTMIGPGVMFLTMNHRGKEHLNDAAPITVGDDVWIGGGARILPGVRIHDGASVGAGAVVTRDVFPGTTVVGVPAREIVKTSPRVARPSQNGPPLKRHAR